MNSQNEFLLLKAIDKETWNVVGGAVDLDEDLAVACRREFREETGSELGFALVLFDAEIMQFDERSIFDAVLNLFYLVRIDDGFKVELEDGYEKAEWFSLD